MAWKKVKIQLENGTYTDAQAPEIISASRSTDIPAFYSDWFFHRLSIGYSAWINPFNGTKSYVAYSKTKFIVFWSKNPKPLLKYIDILKEKHIGCYIQYTLNDYEKEQLEAGVPPLSQRIETFKLLSEKLGKKAVIWRFDPMILTDKISMEDLLGKVKNIGEQIHNYTEKLVFSYADITSYKKVKYNLEKNSILYKEWDEYLMDEFAAKLSLMNKRLGWNLQLATCGEKIDIDRYGIKHNRCIDCDLIVQLAWKNKELMDFLKIKIKKIQELGLFDNKEEIPKDAIYLPNRQYFISTHKKDLGQRLLCGCMAAKDIGEYNTCPHLCEYCYANTTKQIAIENWKRHRQNNNADTITGK